MTDEEREKDRLVRREAVEITTTTFQRMSPPPLRSVHQVAPIVYSLLMAGVDRKVIEQALIIARSHTVGAIEYALRTLEPPSDKNSKPVHRPIEIPPPFKPTEAEKKTASKHIAAARAAIHGDKSGLT